MGFFGSFVFDGEGWRDFDPAVAPQVTEPWLSLLIHDSDFAVVAYRPHGSGTGLAYLGATPRVYFDDGEASPPTDPDAEASGISEWLLAAVGSTDADSSVKPNAIRPYLASDDDPETESEDQADIFVEIKAAGLLRTLRLPLPPAIADVDRMDA